MSEDTRARLLYDGSRPATGQSRMALTSDVGRDEEQVTVISASSAAANVDVSWYYPSAETDDPMWMPEPVLVVDVTLKLPALERQARVKVYVDDEMVHDFTCEAAP